jgi:hypothetical protein
VERGEGERREVRWRTVGALPFIGAEGGVDGGQWFKAEEWLALMGMKQLTHKWRFTPWKEEGGTGKWVRDVVWCSGQRFHGKAGGGGVPCFGVGGGRRGWLGQKG